MNHPSCNEAGNLALFLFWKETMGPYAVALRRVLGQVSTRIERGHRGRGLHIIRTRLGFSLSGVLTHWFYYYYFCKADGFEAPAP